MAAVDVLPQRFGVQRLVLRAVADKALLAVWDVQAAVQGTLCRQQYAVGSCAIVWVMLQPEPFTRHLLDKVGQEQM